MKPESAADSASKASAVAGPSATPLGASGIDPIALFSVFRHPLRLKLLRLLAGGRPMSATEASEVLHQKVNAVIQQFKILRQSGIVVPVVSSEDARFLLYYIPTKWIPEVNVLKFDFCVINFSAIPDYPIRKQRR
jgi:predicted transcriptional regulator